MYVVEFISHPLSTGWASMETVAAVATESELVDFFEAELGTVIGADLVGEVEDILEAAQWPECTAHYRISRFRAPVFTGKRTRLFTDN